MVRLFSSCVLLIAFFTCTLGFARNAHHSHSSYKHSKHRNVSRIGHSKRKYRFKKDRSYHHQRHHSKWKLPSTSEIEAVHIKIEKVWAHTGGKKWILLNSRPQNVELIDFSKNAVGLLSEPKLKAGRYSWLYLDISSRAYVIADGKRYSLKVPFGIKSGIWLKGPFAVQNGEIELISLDFKPSKNIHRVLNKFYVLNPVIRILNVEEKDGPEEDVQAPIISIASPSPGSTNQSIQNIRIEYADENIDLNSLSIKVDGIESKSQFAINSTSAEGNLSLFDGYHTIEASISDTFGNQGVAADVTVFMDSVGPILTISSPQEGSNQIPGDISFSGSSSEALAYLSVNGQEVTLSSNATTFSGVVQASSPGYFALAFIARDALGNQSQKTVNVNIQEPGLPPIPPDPKTVAPALSSTSLTSFNEAVSFLYSGPNPIQMGVSAGSIQDYRASVVRGRILKDDRSPLEGVKVTVVGHPEYGYTISRYDGAYDLVVNGGQKIHLNFERANYLSIQREVDASWNDYSIAPEAIMIGLDSKMTSINLSSPGTQVAKANTVTDVDGTRTATLMFPPQTTAKIRISAGATQSVSSLNIRMTEFTVGENGLDRMPAKLPPDTAYTYAVELSADEAIQLGALGVEFNQPVYFYLENFINLPVGSAVPSGYYDFDQARWVPAPNGRVVKVLSTADGKAVLDVTGSGSASSQSDLDSIGLAPTELSKIAMNYSVGSVLWRIPITHFSAYDFNMPLHRISNVPPPPNPRMTNNENQVPNQCGSIINPISQTFGEQIALPGTGLNLVYRSERTSGYGATRNLRIPLIGEDVPNEIKRIGLRIEVAGQVYDEFFDPSPNLVKEFTWDGLDIYGRKPKGEVTATIKISYFLRAPYISTPVDVDYAFGRLWEAGQYQYIDSERPEMITTRENTIVLGNFDSKVMGIGGWTLSNYHYLDKSTHLVQLGSGGNQKMLGRLIEKVAGQSDGILGDGGPAIDANVITPQGIDIGPDGSVYISDSNNLRIRKISVNGIISTVGGTGEQMDLSAPPVEGTLATETAINYPHSLAVSDEGEIYFYQDSPSLIRKIDKNGIITTVLNGSTYNSTDRDVLATKSRVGYIYDLTFSPDGKLFFSHQAGSGEVVISYIDSRGYIRRFAGNEHRTGTMEDNVKALDASINSALGINFGPDGSLYYTDSYFNYGLVRKVSTDGIVSTVAGNPSGIELDEDGAGALEVNLHNPVDVFVNSDGSFYVSNQSIKGGEIDLVDADGFISRIAGAGLAGFSAGDGGPALQAIVRSPSHLAMGQNGEIYFLQEDNGTNVRKISRAIISKSFGASEIPISSKDGSEIYVFDSRGKHIKTLFSDLGTAKEKFNYDSQGRLISIEDSLGRMTRIQRDSNGDPLSITSPDGVQYQFSVNSEGYLAGVTQPDGKSYSFEYVNDGLLSRFEGPNSAASTFVYNDRGQLIKDTNAVGGYKAIEKEFLNEYNQYKFNIQVSTAEGRKTLISFDNSKENQNLQTQRNPSGYQMTFLKTSGIRQEVQTSDGVIRGITVSGDPRFRMQSTYVSEESIELPSGLRRVEKRDRSVQLNNPSDIFQVQLIIDQININDQFYYATEFNGENHQYSITTPLGKISGVQVDDLNRPILSFQGEEIEPISYAYNAGNKLSEVTQGSRTYKYGYDRYGYLNSVINPLNQTTLFENDKMGRVLTQTLTDGREVLFTYDGNGNVTSVTPPGRPVHSFVLDLLGYLGKYIPPELTGPVATEYTYNLDNQLVQISRPDGKNVNYFYDEQKGLLNEVQASYGSFSYSYNPSSGALTSIISPDGVMLSYQYDGSLRTKRTWSGTVSGSVVRTYNNNFKMISQKVMDQNLSFTYDGDGDLQAAGDMTINRRYGDSLPSYVFLGSAETSYSYNEYGEIATYTAPNYLLNLSDRDSLGRINKKVETIQGATTEYSYTYDLAGRLTDVHKDGSLQRHYGYDANSNRVSVTSSSGSVSANCDNQDRLLSYGNLSFSYNQNGDLLTRTSGSEVTRYDYDVFGNLKKVALPNGNIVEYVIDGENRRVGRKKNGVLQSVYLYSDEGQLIAELDGSQNLQSRFVYGVNKHVPDYMIKSGTNYKLVTDQLGSIRLVVSSSGSIVQRMDYDEFGNVLSDTNPGFQPFGFAGGLYDRDTKLVRFGARDYDPEVGRWTSKDPILFNGGDTNLYGYVMDDPVNFIDQWGLLKYNTSDVSRTGPLSGETLQFAQCLESCAGFELTVTGGSEKKFHSPNSKHYSGQACDFSKKRNPDLDDNTVKRCFSKCAKSSYWGQFENNPAHYHFQIVPGRNGGTGFQW